MISSAGIGGDFGISQRGGYRLTWPSRSPKAQLSDAVFTANGRSAIALAALCLLQWAGARRTTVLMPAYLCPTMIQPLTELGLTVQFYPVADDLSVDPDQILERIDDHTLSVMLLRYFGFSGPEENSTSLRASMPDIPIIDDRTHHLLSDLKSGHAPLDGVIAIYSARKWAPFPDLGLVRWPRSIGPSPSGGWDWAFSGWRTVDVVLRALFFQRPTDWLRRVSLAAYHRAEMILDRRVQVRFPTPLSVLLWRFWNWRVTCHRRQENYRFLLDNWPSDDIVPIFRDLPETVCPLGFPILTSERDRLKQYLIKHAIFPPVHWPRPQLLPADEFGEAEKLYAQELTIPIDQRYGIEHMEHIVKVVERFV